MTTKVKGLLKGLRYISQIFDEKEEEMQIGFPTDVKHVAHIGCDGPSANTPSWMNDFKSSSEVSSGKVDSNGELSSQDISKAGLGAQEQVVKNEIPRSRRHSSSGSGHSSPLGSPTKRGDGSKHSRRHRSRDGIPPDSSKDSSGSSRHARRSHRSSNLGSESPAQEPPGIPKRSHRKSKGSTGGGSTRSSRSKGQDSLTEMQFAELGSVTESGEGVKGIERLVEEKRLVGEVKVE
ncbi:CRIB domain-containing protein RIC7 [Ziziphus jujuba]|uniref:CRIB domain-containing protein RIC7 n=2 Tax=Ziziphus jujuba TaxID=326968 RepID=A0A6P6GB69_ZIZJJ|nr:CRIB domain-containing protein RIC7 [Ziziphus jujuba]